MSNYKGHRYPPDMIQRAVLLYHRYALSLRDIEDILAERGIIVSYETIRKWCSKFGLIYAKKLRKRYGKYSGTWYLDEVFISIRGKQHYLWRAVDSDGVEIDILVQRTRSARAAKRFFAKLFRQQSRVPEVVVTDKLRSYGAALRDLRFSGMHDTRQYRNNIAEQSHQSTRQQERKMRGFRSQTNTQKFFAIRGAVYSHFYQQRHHLSAHSHREMRHNSLAVWRDAYGYKAA